MYKKVYIYMGHGLWIWNYYFGYVMFWTKIYKIYKYKFKKTGYQIPITNVTRGPEIISFNLFCEFIFTKLIDMNLDLLFLYNSLN